MRKILILALSILFVLCFLSCDGSVYSSFFDSSSETETTYAVGDRGPAGGIVFYDKGSYSDGWRYLEAAPADLRLISSGTTPSVDSSADGYSTGTTGIVFGYYRPNGATTSNATVGTGTAIGTGKNNTTLLVNKMGSAAYSSYNLPVTTTPYYAAKLCDDLSYGGYSDWFLPSKDELAQMYAQKSTIGGFGVNFYWSSSEYSAENACSQRFNDGTQPDGGSTRNNVRRVRPLRAF